MKEMLYRQKLILRKNFILLSVSAQEMSNVRDLSRISVSQIKTLIVKYAIFI